VGTGGRQSLNQTLELLRRISGKKIIAKYEDQRPGDITDSLADISKARRLLGYEPTTTFKEGLRLTYAWYKDNLETWSA
jgi:UDP-N-acetylglucosamine 4-epimerase